MEFNSINSSLDVKSEDLDIEDDLDLADDFIDTVLKQVESLCETITNGDPNLQRKLEVNQNLNEAVSCYRVKLLYKQCKIEGKVEKEDKNDEKNQGWDKNEISLSDISNSDSNTLNKYIKKKVLLLVLPRPKPQKSSTKFGAKYVFSPDLFNKASEKLKKQCGSPDTTRLGIEGRIELEKIH